MYNDFIVKVHRYWEEDNGSRGWDGWYFSKVYAIDGNEFLVYDDGGMSAYNGEEDFCETGFNWVDFTATMDRCGENGRQPIVEPLASFNIADYLADRKTEPQTCNDCDQQRCETCVTEIGKDEPQTDRWSHECIGCGNNDTCEFAFTEAVKICRYIVEPQTERSE